MVPSNVGLLLFALCLESALALPPRLMCSSCCVIVAEEPPLSADAEDFQLRCEACGSGRSYGDTGETMVSNDDQRGCVLWCLAQESLVVKWRSSYALALWLSL